MRFILEMDCDNAAFEGDAAPEIARILHKAADTVASDGRKFTDIKLRDVNGNTVGTARLVD